MHPYPEELLVFGQVHVEGPHRHNRDSNAMISVPLQPAAELVDGVSRFLLGRGDVVPGRPLNGLVLRWRSPRYARSTT